MPFPGIAGLLGGVASATSQYFANKDKGDREKRASQADETPVETSPADALTKDVDGGVVDRKKEAEQSMASDKIDFSKPIDPDNMDEAQTKALQEKIGATADGKWGKNSMAKLNTYYRENGIVPPNAKALDQELTAAGLDVKSYVGKGDGNYHIDGKPVKYSSSEVSSGGEVHPVLATVAKEVLGPLNKISKLRVSGGNDAYHLSDEYYADKKANYGSTDRALAKKGVSRKEFNSWGRRKKIDWLKQNTAKSGHTSGNAFDVVVKNKADRGKIEAELSKQFGKPKKGKEGLYYEGDGYMIIDEGDHFHIEAKGKKHKH